MTAYEELKQLVDEIPVLIEEDVEYVTPSFQAWKTQAELFLIERFGSKSVQHRQFHKTYFGDGQYKEELKRSKCQSGLRIAEAVFKMYLKRMEAKLTAHEELKQLVDEIPVLIEEDVDCVTPSFQAWKTKAELFLIERFGSKSVQHRQFHETYFGDGYYEKERKSKCQSGLRISEAVFKMYLERMKEKEKE